MARRWKASLDARLRLLKTPELTRALSAKDRRQRIRDLELQIARLRGKVCSGAWGDAVVHHIDVTYPPPADDPACRMRRVIDLDHLIALQEGQSRDRLFPAIYVASSGYSFDAVIEATEERRLSLIGFFGGELHRRRSSVAVRSKNGEMEYAESR